MQREGYYNIGERSSDGRPFRDGHFAHFPVKALVDQRLTNADRVVLGYLLYRKGLKKRCWPSYSTIAQDTGLSLPQVKRTMRKLQQLGYILMEPFPKDRRRRVYLLQLDGHQGPKSDQYSENQTAILVQNMTNENARLDQANPLTEKTEIGISPDTNQNVVEGGQAPTTTPSVPADVCQHCSKLKKEIGISPDTDLGEIGISPDTDLGSEDAAESETHTAQSATCQTGGRLPVYKEDYQVEALAREKYSSHPLQLRESNKMNPQDQAQDPAQEGYLAIDWRIFFTQSKEKPSGKQKPENIQAMILAVEADLQVIDKALALRREHLRTAHPSKRDALENEIRALEAERDARVTQLQRLRAELASVDATPPAPKAPKAAKVEKTDKKVPAFVQEAQNLDRDALMAELARREERVRTLLEKLETAQAQLKQAAPGEKAALETEIADLTGEIHAEKQRINLLKLQLGAFDVPRGAYQRVLEKTTEPAGKGKKQTKRAVTEKSTRKTHVFALHVKSTKREVCAQRG